MGNSSYVRKRFVHAPPSELKNIFLIENLYENTILKTEKVTNMPPININNNFLLT